MSTKGLYSFLMTAKYVFHLENGAELSTREIIHHKWDLTNSNSVVWDGSGPVLSTFADDAERQGARLTLRLLRRSCTIEVLKTGALALARSGSDKIKVHWGIQAKQNKINFQFTSVGRVRNNKHTPWRADFFFFICWLVNVISEFSGNSKYYHHTSQL